MVAVPLHTAPLVALFAVTSTQGGLRWLVW